MARAKTWMRASLAVVLWLIALRCGDGIREDELVCEEAVAHLEECCPEFRADNFRCVYEPPGCEESGMDPDLSTGVSTCIRDSSCAELRDQGICATLSAPDVQFPVQVVQCLSAEPQL